MKRALIGLFLLVSIHVFAVEGYNDIYLDREQDLYIQGISCGDLSQPRTLKSSVVYSNNKNIATGTYYYSSKYGNFSYTFAPLEGQPSQVMKRGLLKEGQTDKSQMVIDLCLVGPLKGLPTAITKNLQLIKLSVDDPNWSKTMDQYSMLTGRPAFSLDQYEDPRAVKRHIEHDQKVFDANQAYLAALVTQFNDDFVNNILPELPRKLDDAIKYANQEDGFVATKVYPVVEKPSVWTPTSERRYNDQLRQLAQMHEWDKVIQANFDCLFNLTGLNNSLVTTRVESEPSPKWVEQTLHRTATVFGVFENGKTLALEFTVKSSKVDAQLFDNLDQIQAKSEINRQSMIVGKKEPRVIVAVPKEGALTVYNQTEKVN